MQDDWTIYRTRFLVKAKQLTEPMTIVDVLGHEHKGSPGDYLVESSDGSRRIAPRHIFEDVYVPLRRTEEQPSLLPSRTRRETYGTNRSSGTHAN